MCQQDRGDIVGLDEWLLRGITCKDHWHPEKGLTSASFGRLPISCDIESLTSHETITARLGEGAGLVRFQHKIAADIGFNAHHEPEHDNNAHAHLYFDGSGGRKSCARKLARLASKNIINPPDPELLGWSKVG